VREIQGCRHQRSIKDVAQTLDQMFLPRTCKHVTFDISNPRIFAAMNNIESDLQTRWWNLEAKLVERFGKKPDMEAILFLIGIQELGELRNKFTKEQKQDLMHIAVCSLLAQSGYYELEKVDDDGWPHFRQLKSLPVMELIEQENFIKDHVLLYFESNHFL
jgi:hypothetical protein